MKSGRSRPSTAQSQQNTTEKENKIGDKLDDDVYEEISMPDIDYAEREELLK